MRLAFYAPMKAPDHPVPSGDRAVARLLLRALALGGHEVELASRLRSWQAAPDLQRQARLAELGQRLAQRILRRYERRAVADRPQAWLTYHLYYKAPDFLGALVAGALRIPYLLVEVSVANKRAGGPWDLGHRATLAAVAAADGVVQLNPEDAECLPAGTRQTILPAFLDGAPYRAAQSARAQLRATFAERYALDPTIPWLIAVAMMRPGDKLASYEILASALGHLKGHPWHLLLVGDGPARAEVEAAFQAVLGSDVARLRYLGKLAEDQVARPLAASDIFVWPAVNEAYGMALLEAQASGLPAVAGRRPGVAGIVEDGSSGLLVPLEDQAFAGALGALLQDPRRVAAMSASASAKVAARHDLAPAAHSLTRVLEDATGMSPRPSP